MSKITTPDTAHQMTDAMLSDLEKRIKREYEQAAKEMGRKYREYMKHFREEEETLKEAVRAGEMSKADFKAWRVRHIAMGEQFDQMRDVLAADLQHASEISLGISRDQMPDVFALNANFAQYQIAHDAGLEWQFTLYDHNTAAYLLKEQRQLMPGASTALQRKIAQNKAMQWNQKKIQSAVLQGILQGEGADGIAERLRGVAQMGYNASVRYARTMTTSAQNAGRYEGYHQAKAMGIDLKIEWQAILDAHTRHTHRQMHGQRRDVDEPFEVDGIKIMYPAQSSGAGASSIPQSMIWNCRCTLLAWVKGFEGDTVKSSPKMEGKSFEEWQKERPVYDKTKNASGSRQRREKRERLAEAQNVDRKPVENPQVVSCVKPIVGNHTRDQDIMATNPNYLTGGTEYHMNCQRCVTTYEARRRGYDVTALPCYDADDIYGRGKGFTLPYDKGDRKADPLWYSAGLQFSQAKSFTKEQCLVTINTLMEGYGNGSRAIVDGFWSNSGTGHVFVAEYVGGKVQFFDPQNGDMDCSHYFDLMSPATISLFRVDDLPFTAAIKDVFKNAII